MNERILSAYTRFSLIETRTEYEAISHSWLEDSNHVCMIRLPDDPTTMRQEIIQPTATVYICGNKLPWEAEIDSLRETIHELQGALLLFLEQYWIPGDYEREARPEIQAAIIALLKSGLNPREIWYEKTRSKQEMEIYKDQGRLKYIGYKPLGAFAKYHYYRCADCGTDYPVIDGQIRCNGREIFDCSCTPKN